MIIDFTTEMELMNTLSRTLGKVHDNGNYYSKYEIHNNMKSEGVDICPYCNEVLIK